MILALLQRSPIVRIAGWAQECAGLMPSSVLQGTAVLATLGAVDTLAGASVGIQSTSGHSISASTGQAMTKVAFSITNFSDVVGSWQILIGSLPPGVTLSAPGGSLTGPGVINDTSGVVTLSGTPTTAGSYGFQLEGFEYPGGTSNGTNGGNGTGAFLFTLNVTGTSSGPPTITQQPQSQTVTAGSAASISVGVSDSSATIAWKKNGTTMAGATSSTLSFASVQMTDAGSYVATATNASGTATSNAAVLTVNPAPVPPVVAVQPMSVTVQTGSSAVLSATVTGATSYQWYHGSTAVSGATEATLLLSNVTTGNNTGNYFLSAANAAGSVQTNTVAVNATTSGTPGRLINLSVGTTVAANGVLTLGFIVGGSGTTAQENVLVRADGPTLAQAPFNLANAMADPNLNLVFTQGGGKVANNDNWGVNANAVMAADSATGAFPFASTSSLDAALVTALNPGLYSAQVTNNVAAAGFGIGEVYDDTTTYAASIPHLTNLSTLFNVPAGGSLTGGFVVGGSTAKTVLIRAMGPSLAALRVSGAMADPQLTLNATNGASPGVVATNSGWGGDGQIQSVASQVGAFSFSSSSPPSLDSALIYTLQPGITYTATATSASGGGGNVIVEVYEVP